METFEVESCVRGHHFFKELNCVRQRGPVCCGCDAYKRCCRPLYYLETLRSV